MKSETTTHYELMLHYKTKDVLYDQKFPTFKFARNFRYQLMKELKQKPLRISIKRIRNVRYHEEVKV